MDYWSYCSGIVGEGGGIEGSIPSFLLTSGKSCRLKLCRRIASHSEIPVEEA